MPSIAWLRLSCNPCWFYPRLALPRHASGPQSDVFESCERQKGSSSVSYAPVSWTATMSARSPPWVVRGRWGWSYSRLWWGAVPPLLRGIGWCRRWNRHAWDREGFECWEDLDSCPHSFRCFSSPERCCSPNSFFSLPYYVKRLLSLKNSQNRLEWGFLLGMIGNSRGKWMIGKWDGKSYITCKTVIWCWLSRPQSSMSRICL